ncbi:MAG TPA: condensation domain-containing protein, partial [Kofleriaceae bacterium]|nr:condensation domain-containing protein [Kofleriaceae bacterium]
MNLANQPDDSLELPALLHRIAALSPRRRRVLERRLHALAREARGAPIPRRDGAEPAPLSFAQERLWFLDQFQPGTALYNLSFTHRFPDAPSPAVLEQVLQEIVRRHEALRTTFAASDTGPLQIVGEARLALRVVDVGRSGDPRGGVAELAYAETQRPFDLAAGPLVRALLLRAAGDHVLVVTMHHIISDGWSLDVLRRELAALHAAFSSARPSPLPALPLQYADFAIWQRGELAGERLDRLMAYWRSQLDGAPLVLELPGDRPRPAHADHQGALQRFAVPGELADRLRSLAAAEQATLFMALLSAFYVVLHHHSGAEVVLVGSPIANRQRPELEGLIGLFVNTLVLRGDLRARDSFRDLLRQVRATTLAAFAHQDLPFEQLVEELQPQRSTSHNPLFQIMFAMHGAPGSGAAEAAPPADAELATPVPTLSKFDLTLTVQDER